MKKLNNKGLTILELLIATGLISVVILFLYNMLTDVNNEFTNNDFAVNNQINRFEITKLIHSNIVANNELGIALYPNPGDTYHYIFYQPGVTNPAGNENRFNLDVSSNEILITDADGIKSLYIANEFEYGTPVLCGERINVDNSRAIVKLHIPVYTVNEKNSVDDNNLVDDIIFNYYGEYMEGIPLDPC